MTSFPLLDVAMGYVKGCAPELADEQIKNEIRNAFGGFIMGTTSREEIAALLEKHTGSLQALQKVEAILGMLDQPPPAPKTEVYSESFALRKKVRPWIQSEDFRLLAGIHKYGVDNWVAISKFVGNGRTRAQCAQRWARGLDPRISKDQWSPEDDEKFISLLNSGSSKGWTSIAAQMGNRSDVQCRYHFMQMVKEGKIKDEFPNLISYDRNHGQISNQLKATINPSLQSTFFNQQFKPIRQRRQRTLSFDPAYIFAGAPLAPQQSYSPSIISSQSQIYLPVPNPFPSKQRHSASSVPPLYLQNLSDDPEVKDSLIAVSNLSDSPAEQTESDKRDASFLEPFDPSQEKEEDMNSYCFDFGDNGIGNNDDMNFNFLF
ncbi:Myb-like DNA-binding domain containing protein [Histomonas meleagridis]|uniref:Myb-like DNA-binding domain containing protein n=1 Tax=Histomonas meleagridis TaxID=135588 RepID=UPI003559ED67|nr:Myb-like DNA-binding domain containing protein [Histomonas meleagridis]KAH0796874.1 Myb-like DNA-binding domain containing protein [Histomonas meleagridis]